MKKLFFGLAFLGSVLLINGNTKAQETEPGEGGEKWACCQVNKDIACTDMDGHAHYGTEKKAKC
jgi:hypothetical protein